MHYVSAVSAFNVKFSQLYGFARGRYLHFHLNETPYNAYFIITQFKAYGKPLHTHTYVCEGTIA